jgi:hypothetical protein
VSAEESYFLRVCSSDKEILLDKCIKNEIVLEHCPEISFSNGIELLERHRMKQT